MGLFGKEPDGKPAPAAPPTQRPAQPNAPQPTHPAARAAGTACVIGAKTTVKGETPVLRSDLSPTITAIVDELQRTFFGILPAAAIAQCATRAVQDLLGSICLQALPEMANRLATVRLESDAPAAEN